MKKIKARYLVPTDQAKGMVADIIAGELSFTYVELSEEQEKIVKEQMSKFYLHVSICYETEYDDDEYPSRSYDSNDFEIEDMISLTSPCYSTDEARADILLIDGSFAGVISKATRVGGNGWNNYDEWWYFILYTDGTMVGKNESSYCFHGSSSSKEEETTYTLRKKEA